VFLSRSANDNTAERRVLVLMEASPPPSLVAVAFWTGLLVGLLVGAVTAWLYLH